MLLRRSDIPYVLVSVLGDDATERDELDSETLELSKSWRKPDGCASGPTGN